MPEYIAFLPKGVDPPENQQTVLMVRDGDTLETRKVRAVIARTAEGKPAAEKLWLQDIEAVVRRAGNPWWIHVLEVIDEERDEVKVLPKPTISLGKRRGDMLRHLMQRQEKSEGTEGEE